MSIISLGSDETKWLQHNAGGCLFSALRVAIKITKDFWLRKINRTIMSRKLSVEQIFQNFNSSIVDTDLNKIHSLLDNISETLKARIVIYLDDIKMNGQHRVWYTTTWAFTTRGTLSLLLHPTDDFKHWGFWPINELYKYRVCNDNGDIIRLKTLKELSKRQRLLPITNSVRSGNTNKPVVANHMDHAYVFFDVETVDVGINKLQCYSIAFEIEYNNEVQSYFDMILDEPSHETTSRLMSSFLSTVEIMLPSSVDA
jgi:hypothetical protein